MRQTNIVYTLNLEILIASEKVSCIRQAVKWMCGIEKQPEVTPELEEEQKAKAAALLSIKENPKWRDFCAANAVLLMFFAVFICAFFG